MFSKFQVGLKFLLRQGLSEPDFYGDLVYKLKKIVGSNNFSAQFIKIILHYKKIGYKQPPVFFCHTRIWQNHIIFLVVQKALNH